MATATRARAALPLAGPACCPGGLGRPLDRDSATELAHLLKAVADPARLQLLSLVRAGENAEACVCDLTDALGLSQPTVSHHLKVLRESGWVTSERRGSWVHYRIRPEAAARFRALASELGGLGAAIPGRADGLRTLPVLQPNV